MKWWGWGDPAQQPELPAHAVEFLRREIGMSHQLRPAVALEAVRCKPPALRAPVHEKLAAAVGADAVRDDRRTRVLHAAGKSYPDLVRQRAGLCDDAPDAVVFPASHEEVRAVLETCAREAVAVVPFGGGTSVVGGVEPLRDSFDALIALDLGRCRRMVALDERSLTAVFEPGLRCPEAEGLLAQRGLTLGHFPQSYEFATVGGCVATRSAGQASTGYGRIDKLVLGLRCATPSGDLELAAMPASAAGPSVRDLVVGSEGTLGVITQTALRVHPRPPARRYEGWFFRSFREGAEALRSLEQAEAAPHVARLSDEEETRLSLAMAGMRGLKGTAARAYLGARGYAGGCLMILGWEGDERTVVHRRRRGAAQLRRAGGLSMGRAPGSAWERTRFAAPYLRDALLDRGVMVETLETAAQWSGLLELHGAVSGALRDSLSARGTPPLVACHISHLYPSGASLYFTFIARQEAEDPIAQWRVAKSAACDAIVAAGGTITHHHAVGRDHAPWLEAEIGHVGVTALRAAKEALDPAGVMNPGKLLPAAQPAQAPAAAS
ncbi:MAG: alkyldihydroxyacetonephosphate synthase [Solirubrobacteraceae bacterium]|jgi:alkyldihydroxyacetonephosphate synthase|nr:alkyldihydroxyacetonephosphate synthase [Solirubrobacteraceae bacterium]